MISLLSRIVIDLSLIFFWQSEFFLFDKNIYYKDQDMAESHVEIVLVSNSYYYKMRILIHITFCLINHHFVLIDILLWNFNKIIIFGI